MNYGLLNTILFDGKINDSQRQGIEIIIDNAENLSVEQLSYVLATVYHETGRKMQPCEEAGYLSKEKQLAYLKKQKYFPYYGRDLVHTTWLYNYEKVKAFSDIDVVANPELIAQMPLAAQVAITFMIKGWYTGKKLSDYFNAEKEDALNARRIINGTDQAEKILAYYINFKKVINEKA